MGARKNFAWLRLCKVGLGSLYEPVVAEVGEVASREGVCRSFVVFSLGGREIAVGGGAGVGNLLESGKTVAVVFVTVLVEVVGLVGSVAFGAGVAGVGTAAGVAEMAGAAVVTGVEVAAIVVAVGACVGVAGVGVGVGVGAAVGVAEVGSTVGVAGVGGAVGVTGTSMILGSAAASGGREVILKL